MNVQEINGSGKNIWVFAVTAVALTTLALLGWWLTNRVLQLKRIWLNEETEGIPLRRRLERITWLCFHRHTRRVISIENLLGLLTDGRYGEKRPYENT